MPLLPQRLFPRLLRPLLAALPALLSCTGEPFTGQPAAMVVEGWIDDGGFPRVFVTQSVPFTTDGETPLDLSSLILKWARVEVSDDEGNTAVLTGSPMRGYMPPYGFTTTDLRGRSGHTYRLRVDYENHHAEAVTTIPPRPEVSGLETRPCEGQDTLYEVRARLSGPVGGGAAGVKMFVRYADEASRQYLPAYLGLYANASLADGAALPVYSPHVMGNKNFSPYISRKRALYVKVAAVDAASYAFWKSHEEMVSLSRNPFLQITGNLQGNVRGALGYWCGYGASHHLALPPAGR